MRDGLLAKLESDCREVNPENQPKRASVVKVLETNPDFSFDHQIRWT